MALAFEVQNGIDDVFERFRARETAVFGDVPDKEGRNVLAFRGKQHLRRGFAHLPDAAGRRLKLLGEHRLHRIDDDESRLDARGLFEDPFEAGFGEEV